MRITSWSTAAVTLGVTAVVSVAVFGHGGVDRRDEGRENQRRARNVIFFIPPGRITWLRGSRPEPAQA
jgi:hypothetical protein